MMGIIIFFTALLCYALFLLRFAWQGLLWFSDAEEHARGRAEVRPAACLSSALDIFFFRRIFISSKTLWLCSWTFHLSFVFVMLRHLRYFFQTLPDCLILLQPAGLFAGYLLPVSLFFLIVLRTAKRDNRYLSRYNYVISGMLLLLSLSGILMREVFRADPLGVKEFTLGVFSFSPQSLPSNGIFIIHGILFILLLPNLPTHILAAPYVIFDANRRKAELRHIIHDE